MSTATLTALDALADGFSEPAKDIKLNLKAVLAGGALGPERTWGVALACAYNENPTPLTDALRRDGLEHLTEERVADARAAAALMSMTNVYYRFRHMVDKPSYHQMPARLRMTRVARPATTKLEFELMCLAVSAINGCEMCIRSHEATLVKEGLSEEAIHDAIRVAAVVRAAAVSLRMEN